MDVGLIRQLGPDLLRGVASNADADVSGSRKSEGGGGMLMLQGRAPQIDDGGPERIPTESDAEVRLAITEALLLVSALPQGTSRIRFED